MEKLLATILTVILIFSLTACQSSGQISCPAADEPEQINAPGSNGASKPISKEPPALKVLDSTCIGIEANKGTYTWTYDNGDGTQTGVCADSSHPLEWQEFLVPMPTADSTVELYFMLNLRKLLFADGAMLTGVKLRPMRRRYPSRVINWS